MRFACLVLTCAVATASSTFAQTPEPFWPGAQYDPKIPTLEQVVEHYNSQVKPHQNLAPELRTPNGTPRRLNLTAADKSALVAFLKTLSDPAIAADVKYANPFE